MHRFESLGTFDKWMVKITATCAVFLLCWLAYDIAFMKPDLKGQVEIGRIDRLQNKVKRKFHQGMVWYKAHQNEKVYENDWIFTGDQSMANIKLNNQDEIVVEPHSLIVLSKKNGIIQLDLQYGQLLADVKTKKVKIRTQTKGRKKTINTRKGIVRVVNRPTAYQSIEVKKVKAEELKDQKGSQISLMDLARKKNYTPEKGFSPLDGLKLSFPKNPQTFKFRLYKGQTASAPLRWKDPYKNWKNFQLKIKGRKVVNLKKPNYPLKTKKPGLFYWQVRGLDKKGNLSRWSSPQRTRILMEYREKGKPLRLAQSQLSYQLDQEELAKVRPDKSYPVAPNKTLKIQWEPEPEAKHYNIQFSHKKDFSQVTQEQSTPQAFMAVKELNLKPLFFRVTPEIGRGIPIAHGAKGLITTLLPPEKRPQLSEEEEKGARGLSSLETHHMWSQPAPRITGPEPRKTFIMGPSSPLFMVIHWTYEGPFSTYEVEIAKEPSMETLVYSRLVKSPREAINQKFKPGIYFIRVGAVNEEGGQKHWSSIEAFRVLHY